MAELIAAFHIVARVGQHLFHRANRRQNVLEFAAANPATGATRVILREEWPTGWIENNPSMYFLKDGRRFVWESFRNGWTNLYLYDLSGKLIRPRFTDRIVGQDGRVEEEIDPAQQAQVMKPETAEQLTQMMADVVNEGTGTAAALSDVTVAGKTGTAEVKNETLNQVWFIGFAPVEAPRYAIAVTLEDQPIGTSGGANAAPLAAQVLQTLLGGG